LRTAAAQTVDGLSGASGTQNERGVAYAKTGATQWPRDVTLGNNRLMFSAARTAPLTRFGPRPVPIAFSLVVHACLLSLVAFGPVPARPLRSRSLYDEVIKPHQHDLVWY